MRQLIERADDRFSRTLHVGLDDQRQFFGSRFLEPRHHAFERRTSTRRAGRGAQFLGASAVISDFACARFVIDRVQHIAWLRHAFKTHDLDRLRRPCALQLLTALVGDRTNAAHLCADDDDIAALQRAHLHEHRSNRAAALIELGLDNRRFCRPV